MVYSAVGLQEVNDFTVVCLLTEGGGSSCLGPVRQVLSGGGRGKGSYGVP